MAALGSLGGFGRSVGRGVRSAARGEGGKKKAKIIPAFAAPTPPTQTTTTKRKPGLFGFGGIFGAKDFALDPGLNGTKVDPDVAEFERLLSGKGRPRRKGEGGKRVKQITTVGAAPGILPVVPAATSQVKKKRKKIGVGSTLLTGGLGDTGDANIQKSVLLGG